MPLHYVRGTRTTDVFLGYLPQESAEKTKAGLEELTGLIYMEFLAEHGQNVPAALIAHKTDSKKIKEFIKANGFTDARLEGLDRLPREHIEELTGQIQSLEKAREDILSKAQGLLQYKRELLELEDYFRSGILRAQALEKIIVFAERCIDRRLYQTL